MNREAAVMKTKTDFLQSMFVASILIVSVLLTPLAAANRPVVHKDKAAQSTKKDSAIGEPTPMADDSPIDPNKSASNKSVKPTDGRDLSKVKKTARQD
jgi:hypothetical protein